MPQRLRASTGSFSPRHDSPPALSIPPLNNRDHPEPSELQPPESLAGSLRAWRWLFGLLGLAVLVLGFYAEENWRGHRAWELCQRNMAARGEPSQLSGLVPPPVGEPENFATTPFLAAIVNFRPGMPLPRDTNALVRLRDFAVRYDAASEALKLPTTGRSNSWGLAHTDWVAWYGAFLDATNPPASRGRKAIVLTNLTPREAASRILTCLSESDAVFDELRAASYRPYSRFNLNYEAENPATILLPHLAPLKHLCQVLRLRASAELAIERPDEAFEDIHLMLALVDACRSEPILISHLVRFSEFQMALQPIAEGLAARQWSEAHLKKLQDRLGSFDFLADGRRALQSEGVWLGAGMIDYVRRSHGRLDAIADTSGGAPEGVDLLPLLLRLAPTGYYDFEKANLNRLAQDYLISSLDLARRQVSPTATRQGEEKLTTAFAHPRSSLFFHHRLFASVFLPSLTQVGVRAAYNQTAADLAVLACGLERYRLAHGQIPRQLDQLVPEFLDHLPRDIINGQPLSYRPAPDGAFVLYSVGWNERDDGARIGLSPKEDNVDPKNGDWIWRGPTPR